MESGRYNRKVTVLKTLGTLSHKVDGYSALSDGVLAGAVAWGPSGLPSTLHAVLTGRDVLGTVRAAGSLLAPPGAGPVRLYGSAVVAHTAISLGWGAVMGVLLPRRRSVVWGAAAGLAIAALDLGVVARRVPRLEPIRRLPVLPQVADHIAFGAIVGAVLAARARRRPRPAGAQA
jgi:hypothetical protein